MLMTNVTDVRHQDISLLLQSMTQNADDQCYWCQTSGHQPAASIHDTECWLPILPISNIKKKKSKTEMTARKQIKTRKMLKRDAFWYRQDKTMCTFSAFGKASSLATIEFGNDYFSTAIFKSNIRLSVSFSWFISVCPFVAVLKAMYVENSHALFCLVDIKKRSFLTSCVFWFVFLNASSHLNH